MLDEVRCQGSETRITDCYHNGYGSSDCSHSRDAGVRCQFGKIPQTQIYCRMTISDNRYTKVAAIMETSFW